MRVRGGGNARAGFSGSSSLCLCFTLYGNRCDNSTSANPNHRLELALTMCHHQAMDTSKIDTIRAQGTARQASLKARRIAAGLKPVTNLWLHPADVAPVRALAAELSAKRQRD